MGADSSKVDSKMDGMYNSLPADQRASMKKAEVERGRRLSIKTKTKTEFLGDVTAYPEKQYTVNELEGIEKFLSKRLSTLEAQIKQLSSNDMAGFIRIYSSITDGNDQSAVASQMPKHRVLNRYNNIVAYDASRVKVTPNEYTHHSDYINANYVHGHGHSNMYIATQGPVNESMAAFWQMVWEQKVQMIVMVTNEVEGERLKAHRYWPDTSDEAVEHGDYQIQMTEFEPHPTYIGRCFKVIQNSSGQSRFVFHYQYIVWPDHGVPETSVEMLKFRAVVKEKYNKEGPMLVHCSAGVGRTGTFIGIDRFLDSCADLDDKHSVLDIVKDMRISRNYMVQAQVQFIYLYEAVTDGVRKLLDKVRRELKFSELDKEEKEAAILKEIEVDMQAEAEMFRARLRSEGSSPKSRVTPHVRHNDGSRYTDDLNKATALPPETRIMSLAHSTAEWTKRGNVPMDAAEHGYQVESVDLETRLNALSESRTRWMKVYSEAEKTWQSAQDEEGVFYDVGHQLTSIESRVMSLANADAAWVLSGNSQHSVYEEMQNENLANLELRLQSLAYTLMTSEQRWKDRGHGFRGPTDQGHVDAQMKASNSKYQGTLSDRLVSLQTEHTAWKRRSGMSKYDKEKFFEEVGKEYERQEEIKAEREAELARLQEQKEKEKREGADREPTEQDLKQQAAAEAEKRRRQKARAVAKASSTANVGEYLPHSAQMQKKNAKQAEEDKKAAAEAAKRTAEEDKKQAQIQQEANKKNAKAKASKFLKKMSK